MAAEWEVAFLQFKKKYTFYRSFFNKTVLSKIHVRQEKYFLILLLELHEQNLHVCCERVCRRS